MMSQPRISSLAWRSPQTFLRSAGQACRPAGSARAPGIGMVPVSSTNNTLAVDGVCCSCGPLCKGPRKVLADSRPLRWNEPSWGSPLNMALSTFKASVWTLYFNTASHLTGTNLSPELGHSHPPPLILLSVCHLEGPQIGPSCVAKIKSSKKSSLPTPHPPPKSNLKMTHWPSSQSTKVP
jgi:hypothetical protein